MRASYKKYVKVVLNLLTAGVTLLLLIFLLPRVLGFFIPFVIGWIISMIANPLVRFLDEKLKIRRKAGSAIVIIAVIGLIIHRPSCISTRARCPCRRSCRRRV